MKSYFAILTNLYIISPTSIVIARLNFLISLVVNSDSSYSTSIDKTVISEGSLLSDLTPPINPVKRIADPEDKKPEEWDERERLEVMSVV